MAFTNYKTWSAGETLTAANFNQQIRDNGLVMAPHLVGRKTADQSVTSSTTLVDCTTLTFAVAASEVWQFEFGLIFNASSAGDLKIGFTFPASGRIDASSSYWNEAATMTILNWSGTTTPTSSQGVAGRGGATRDYMPISGIFTNSSTAGNLQLQFAQNTSDGTATTIYANSTAWAMKLA